MINIRRTLSAFVCALSLSGVASTEAEPPAESYKHCLMRILENGDDNLTLLDIRRRCEHLKPRYYEWQVMGETDKRGERLEYEQGVISDRILSEETVEDNRFVITPHKPNYLLPFSYDSIPNREPFGSDGHRMSKEEVKFQISLKAPLWRGVFNGYGDLFVAYTNTSWWQAYNSGFSSPFRETNHEPEAFFAFPTNYRLFGFRLRAITFGINHQSNGRQGSISRSWNRIMLGAFFERDNFYFVIQPWYRIPENSKNIYHSDYPNVRGDDNPGIERFMGYGELNVGIRMKRHHVSVMLRNNLRSDNLGAIQVDWSFPLTERFRGYIQFFNGYGESLIDYNANSNRFSFGVMLTDWL